MNNPVWVRLTFLVGLGSFALGIILSGFNSGRPASVFLFGSVCLWLSLYCAAANDEEHETTLSRYYDMNWPLWVLIVLLLWLTIWPIIEWLKNPVAVS